MKAYGGFCPIAKGAEVFAERWTPLIIRELYAGSTRFNELEQGLPGIPRSLLVQRLRSLARAGVIERRVAEPKNRPNYVLTQAGRELSEIVLALGIWGYRWAFDYVHESDVDPRQLMWDMRRRIHLDRLPDRRVVVQFDFVGAASGSYWLVLERDEPSVCHQDPGFDIDLLVTADAVTLHRVWMGQRALTDAIREGLVEVDGSRKLAREFPTWLALNTFAEISPPKTSRRTPA
jgi:DNA-binding HxlR family transcriptional regulator